jgi:tyrosyl-tRNA synthetase
MRVGAILMELGFTASNGEAKRKIAEGAVRLDDAVVADPALLVALPAGATARVSLGRKKHAVLRGPVT